jgi:sugar-specific transcriptional regulator TrmB
METKEILQKIGLSEDESAVYLALLRFGALSISQLSEKTKLYRPSVYKAIPSLEEKGLAHSTKKGKRKLYMATSPEKLSSLLSSLGNDLSRALPDMLAEFNKKEKRPFVIFLDGVAGIRRVYDDIVTTLKKGDTFYRYSSSRSPKKRDYYVSRDYPKKRDEKQLERYVITSEGAGKLKKPKFEKSVKTVPKSFDLFEYDITQIIYADKIAFVDYNTETAIIIENPVIAQFQQKIFKLLFLKL